MQRNQIPLVVLATVLITVGIAAQTGSPGHSAIGSVSRTLGGGPQVALKWSAVGGVTESSVGVSSWGSDHTDIFVRGTDDALWQRTWDGRRWSEWHSLGGVLRSAPAAVSWGPNRIDVFARGQDDGVWHRG